MAKYCVVVCVLVLLSVAVCCFGKLNLHQHAHAMEALTGRAAPSMMSRRQTTCSDGEGAVGDSCSSSKGCQTSLGCVSGSCTYVQAGDTCASSAFCGGDYAECIEDACDTYRGPGDPCLNALDCYSGQCVSGKCVSKGVNSNCTGSDCMPGLYCSVITGLCTEPIALDSDCSEDYAALSGSSITYTVDLYTLCDSSVCDFALVGTTPSGTCKGLQSVSSDGECGPIAGSIVCASNLYCTASFLTFQYGVCTAEISSACDDSLACLAIDQYCDCSTDIAGTCTQDECIATLGPAALSCVVANGCPWGISFSNFYVDGSCSNQCASEFNDITCCDSNTAATADRTYVPSGICSSDAVSIAASFGLILALALFLLIF